MKRYEATFTKGRSKRVYFFKSLNPQTAWTEAKKYRDLNFPNWAIKLTQIGL